jgi:hypothetical protein
MTSIALLLIGFLFPSGDYCWSYHTDGECAAGQERLVIEVANGEPDNLYLFTVHIGGPWIIGVVVNTDGNGDGATTFCRQYWGDYRADPPYGLASHTREDDESIYWCE